MKYNKNPIGISNQLDKQSKYSLCNALSQLNIKVFKFIKIGHKI